MKRMGKILTLTALVAVTILAFSACKGGEKGGEESGGIVEGVGDFFGGIGGWFSSLLGGGTFTLTDIPEEYNGMYAVFTGTNTGQRLSVSGSAKNAASGSVPGKADLSPISKGRVKLPLWILEHDKYSRYSGDDTLAVNVSIYTNKTIGSNDELQLIWELNGIEFKKGKAAKLWNDGRNRKPQRGTPSRDVEQSGQGQSRS